MNFFKYIFTFYFLHHKCLETKQINTNTFYKLYLCMFKYLYIEANFNLEEELPSILTEYVNELEAKMKFVFKEDKSNRNKNIEEKILVCLNINRNLEIKLEKFYKLCLSLNNSFTSFCSEFNELTSKINSIFIKNRIKSECLNRFRYLNTHTILNRNIFRCSIDFFKFILSYTRKGSKKIITYHSLESYVRNIKLNIQIIKLEAKSFNEKCKTLKFFSNQLCWNISGIINQIQDYKIKILIQKVNECKNKCEKITTKSLQDTKICDILYLEKNNLVKYLFNINLIEDLISYIKILTNKHQSENLTEIQNLTSDCLSFNIFEIPNILNDVYNWIVNFKAPKNVVKSYENYKKEKNKLENKIFKMQKNIKKRGKNILPETILEINNFFYDTNVFLNNFNKQIFELLKQFINNEFNFYYNGLTYGLCNNSLMSKLYDFQCRNYFIHVFMNNSVVKNFIRVFFDANKDIVARKETAKVYDIFDNEFIELPIYLYYGMNELFFLENFFIFEYLKENEEKTKGLLSCLCK